ncbi:MAG TPA: sugar ABC transporter permease [Candidatus Excrementavichristensenella intestinipullorum]|nr:sugar ABC transporter permease [Candidatus Excrementavichristensenella intestinipullorum]
MKQNALKTAHGKRAAYVSNQRPLLWLLPLFVVLLAFFLVPTLDVIRLSFTNASLAKPSYDYTTKSYLKVIRDSAFPEIMSVTLIFVSISVVFQFLLGFVIAYCVDKGEKYRLRGTVAVRTISLVSWAIPGVAIGIIWKIMYAENAGGILNYLLSLLGFGQVAFLSDPNTAIFSVCLANIWRGTAQSMILLYSGLKTVPADVLEAADVDGASNWRKIVSVTIPSMKSVITVNILLNIINTFNTFDMIMPLTGGGPGHSTEVLVLGAYRTIFQQLDMGKGCAMAVILLCINVFFSLIYIRAGKEED